MRRARKHKPLPPRRKRLKRAARLQAARAWLRTYSGPRVVKAYARWFGVDLGCALKELQMLDVPLDQTYVAALHRTLELRSRAHPDQRQQVYETNTDSQPMDCFYWPFDKPESASYAEALTDDTDRSSIPTDRDIPDYDLPF